MKKKNFLIICILVLLIAIGVTGVTWVARNTKKENTVSLTNNQVKHKVVENLYETIKATECNEMPIIEETTKVEELDQNNILYLIFSKMNEEQLLKEEILLETMEITAQKLFGKKDVFSNFTTYNYGGYLYTLRDNKITRVSRNCDNKKYISKLYGYTNNKERLEARIHYGYIENGKVYDLKGQELGIYEENQVSNILEIGTPRIYHYKMKNNEYYLEKIEIPN